MKVMYTNVYQKSKEKHIANKLYRKLSILVYLVYTLRGQTGQFLKRDERKEALLVR